MGYKKITNFYISQTKSSLDKIFYKVISSYYLHVTFDDIFCRGSHRFHEDCGFAIYVPHVDMVRSKAI
jgi:hypothetical protein